MLPERFRKQSEKLAEDTRKGILDESYSFGGQTVYDLLTEEEEEQIRKELEAKGIKLPKH